MSASEKAPDVKPPLQPGVTVQKFHHLEKGQLLFQEGDLSKSMYLVKSGLLRIFKKKGDAVVEIDTIRSGQLIGELAFLDGNPRSASAEALMPCDLIEISSQQFVQTLGKSPEWIKVLLKAIVTRLRSSTNRIKQLETASTAIDYSAGAKTKATYVFVAPHEALKICTALLLVASRNGQLVEKGITVSMTLMERYACQIMGIPAAKLTAYLEVLASERILDPETGVSTSDVLVTDLEFLEHYIGYLATECQAEPAKRHDITDRSYQIMCWIRDSIVGFSKDEATGVAKVNLVEVQKAAAEKLGRDSFLFDECQELIERGYLSAIQAASATDAMTEIKVDFFLTHARFQGLMKALDILNDEKKKKSGIAA